MVYAIDTVASSPARRGAARVTRFSGPPLDTVTGIGATTLARFVPDIASRYGSHEALVFDDPITAATTRWSYNALVVHTDAIARALLADGTTPGTRVGILMGNRPEAVAATFGAALIGAVPVLCSTFAPPPELATMLRAAEVKTLLTQTRLLDRDFPSEIATLRTEVPELRNVIAFGNKEWDFWLTSAGRPELDTAVIARLGAVDPDDDGLILFSSGTTSTPKAMVHSQHGPALAFWLQGRVFRRDAATRMWSPLPMFWSAGLNSAVGATLAMGGTCVLQETFDPGAALRLLERERVTEPYALPHQNRALAEHAHWNMTDLSSLRQVYGKSVYARHPKVDGDTTWNMPVGYGLSETCALFTAHDASTPREALRASYGTLLPGNELRVVDPETRTELGAGDEGELCVRGPSLMKRYLGRTPAETFDAEGFFHTGDLGSIDADGNVHFDGRSTEMIKTAGANVAPAEVEVQLQAFAPVKVSRIIGMPDAGRDEIVVAAITLKDGASATAEDVREFLRTRVASYKVPREVLFFADGEIPMTSAGSKVRDPELAALVARRLAPHGPDTDPEGAS